MGKIKETLSRFILHISGWKVICTIPDLNKCVICVAPHTSNWDFIWGKLAYLSIGRFAGFLIKKDWFFFPFNRIFSSMGGIPVDRSRKTDLVEQIAQQYKTHERFSVAITPEATRKRNPNWKMGFYYIALKAEVPIVLAYLDYGKKEIGLTRIFYPTGNEEADLKEIKAFYWDKRGRFPERFAIELRN